MHPFRFQLEMSPWYDLLTLDGFLGHRARHRLLFFLKLFLLLLTLVAAAPWFVPFWIKSVMPFIVGLIFLALAGWLLVYLIEAYCRYHYFPHSTSSSLVSFEAGRFLYQTAESDLVVGFLVSTLGQEWLRRLGIGAPAAEQFLEIRRVKHISTPLALAAASTLSLSGFLAMLIDGNPDFDQWLLASELKKSDALGAARWVEGARAARRERERWWTRARLGRIPGLARDWSYGESYTLNQYGPDLLTAPETAPTAREIGWLPAAVEAVETILVRAREANALIVGAAGEPLEVVYELSKLIRTGRSLPALEPKHPKLLYAARLFARFKDRQGLESELIKIFDEVVSSGNIILVIDDLPSFVAGAAAAGANLEQLLDPYLASSRVQVVALAETAAYHRALEANPLLRERFEVVTLAPEAREATVDRLMMAVETLERRGRVLVTYPALAALVDIAEEFPGGESVADKALDLLFELAPWAERQGLSVIGKPAALTFATDKLKVPFGEVGPVEREQLLNLEKSLHARVIGQDQAIVSIANALRRSRTGIRNLKRPLGSFLFLGPTGVGKTETAKALAAVFFHGEDRLLRLDMSEYRGADALKRLIGSLETGEPGVLAKLLRDEPYGVLLLDEFEKTEPEVLDLFLQILDEGFFSDMRAERVNARNIMFIATSNAGAPLIWDLVSAGHQLLEAEKTIIDALISQGIFKPELLNRFDAVIIFNPLSESEGLAVARLLLTRLAARLKERGLTLKVTDEIAAAVVKNGLDRQFGARPMARYIQDQIEQLIANELLTGAVKSGQTAKLIFNPSGQPMFAVEIEAA